MSDWPYKEGSGPVNPDGRLCCCCARLATTKLGTHDLAWYCTPCAEEWSAYIKDPDNVPRPHLREREFSERMLAHLKKERS